MKLGDGVEEFPTARGCLRARLPEKEGYRQLPHAARIHSTLSELVLLRKQRAKQKTIQRTRTCMYGCPQHLVGALSCVSTPAQPGGE